MAELLWEIGSEELPAVFVAPALAQMAGLFRDKFGRARLWEPDAPGASLRTLGTPRRLVLHATGLAAQQPDETVTVKGPAQHIAFDPDGNPTRAALGFAQKNGVPAETLAVVDGYVQATVTRRGREAREIAGELLPAVVRELSFPKAMRWGAGKMRFARPLRWILALLDDQVIPCTLEHVSSGRRTRGHRFLSPDEAEVAAPAAYFAAMRDKFVLLDPEERRARILSQAEHLAGEAGGEVQIASELLDENVFLTEYPTAVLGGFDPDYLSLPRPVLVTAMRKHQRYFPLTGKDGRLLPRFIAVRNGGAQYLDVVRAGFENVLAARFADAKFFFDLDTQTPLEAKIEGTRQIVFQEKLGTVYDKSRRLETLLRNGGLLDRLAEPERADVLRAAHLCKADLASEMVKELPSLQGIVGEEYARRDGEADTVAAAIAEHYLPRGAGDSLPAGDTGRLLATADRVDTLAGYLSIGIMPSGTSDPYALRRAASGLVALLSAAREVPPLETLFGVARRGYAAQNIALSEEADAAFGNFLTLMRQRLDAALEEKGVRYDVREAVLATSFHAVAALQSRALALNAAIETPAGKDALAAAVRIGNIVRFARREGIPISDREPDPSLFTDEAESTLWAEWLAQRETFRAEFARGEWAAALEVLARLRLPADRFFDAVMVLGDDLVLRDNRLALLARLRDAFGQIADFDKIVTG